MKLEDCYFKPQDHPDFIGGWKFTDLETRKINEHIGKVIQRERNRACAIVRDMDYSGLPSGVLCSLFQNDRNYDNVSL